MTVLYMIEKALTNRILIKCNLMLILYLLLFSSQVAFDSFATQWSIACQAPLSTGFPRQEYWSGLPFPSPGDVLYPGIKPMYPVLVGGFFATQPPGKSLFEIISQQFGIKYIISFE